MIQAKCPNCGAPLTFLESSVLGFEGVAYIRHGSRYTCEYCGSTFTGGDEIGPYTLSGIFNGPVSVGGSVIDMRGSQGAVYNPSNPVVQNYFFHKR